jgi:hypothetical protein
MTTRPCRGCGAPFVPAEQPVRRPASLRFCAACRANTCGTCYGRGQHRAGCPVAAGRARLPRPYRGLVSAAEFIAVFEQTYTAAVRAAERIVGVAASEDAVMDAIVYLWCRRDTLTAIRPRLVLIATRQRAHHERRSAWRRYVVPVDNVVAIEEMTTVAGRGNRRWPP